VSVVRKAIVLAASLALAGCASQLLGPEPEVPIVYRLQAPTTSAPAAARLPLALSVSRPRAPASLDTDRIATTWPDRRFDYYAGLRWSEAAPQMLQSLLVGALQSAGRFDPVVAAPSRVPTDLLLDVELRSFEARYPAAGPPVARVEVQFTLVDARRGQRLSSLLATGEAAAAQDRRAEVLAAFESATAEVTGKVAAWLGTVDVPAGLPDNPTR
jgi:cholesterol transport system auxiliary component